MSKMNLIFLLFLFTSIGTFAKAEPHCEWEVEKYMDNFCINKYDGSENYDFAYLNLIGSDDNINTYEVFVIVNPYNGYSSDDVFQIQTDKSCNVLRRIKIR